MRYAVPRPFALRPFLDARHGSPGEQIASRAEDLLQFVDMPARVEAVAESALPYIERVSGRRAERRRRGRGRLLVVCALLTAAGVAAAWMAWRSRRDDEYARLIVEPEGPRVAPAAGGPAAPAAGGPVAPTAPSGPAAPPFPPSRSDGDAPPAINPAGVPGLPAREPLTAAGSQPARARTHTGPTLPATPAPSQYLRSHRAELPPAPDTRPTLPT